MKFNTNLLEWRMITSQTEDDPIKNIIQNSIQAACTILALNARSSMGDSKQWTGSGFHVGDGLIVTAAHVIPPDFNGEIILSFDGINAIPAQLVISEPNFDVAILLSESAAKMFPSVQLGDSDKSEIGDIIATIASPEGWNDTATVGRISNIHQSLGEYAPTPAWNDIMFIDADILEGASGGMVIGTDGLVRGSIMGVAGEHAEIGIGQRSICPSNKIKVLLHQAKGQMNAQSA